MIEAVLRSLTVRARFCREVDFGVTMTPEMVHGARFVGYVYHRREVPVGKKMVVSEFLTSNRWGHPETVTGAINRRSSYPATFPEVDHFRCLGHVYKKAIFSLVARHVAVNNVTWPDESTVFMPVLGSFCLIGDKEYIPILGLSRDEESKYHLVRSADFGGVHAASLVVAVKDVAV